MNCIKCDKPAVWMVKHYNPLLTIYYCSEHGPQQSEQELSSETSNEKPFMTKEEFWNKWIPCDRPPITPTEEEKKEFFDDLDLVIKGYLEKSD